MSYIDGFVIAVPKANKQKFINHARLADGVFMDLGALRVVECWSDDVPEGQITDFRSCLACGDLFDGVREQAIIHRALLSSAQHRCRNDRCG